MNSIDGAARTSPSTNHVPPYEEEIGGSSASRFSVFLSKMDALNGCRALLVSNGERTTEVSMGQRFIRSIVTTLSVVVATTGLVTTSAVAGSTNMVSTSSFTAAGRAYARHLLAEQVVPPRATLSTTLPTPLAPEGEENFRLGQIIATHQYLLTSPIDLEAFVRRHLRKGESVSGTGTENGPHTNTAYSVAVSLPCVSRHVTYCGLDYVSTLANDGRSELRVDLEIDWLPIKIVTMPTKGVVTLTGYGTTSLSQGSSDPTSVTLTLAQARRLRAAIATLKESGGAVCMEDSLLLKVVIRSGSSHHVLWSATADECPGVLSITTAASRIQLDDRSCSLWRVIAGFFPAGTAHGTRAVNFCVSPQ
jgi:hypothetical protein